LNATGKVSFLRLNEGGFGPPNDFLDAEVIFMLDTMPNRAFGFQLRPDGGGPAHEGMLGLLRDSFNNHQTVTIDFNQVAGKRNNIAFRIALIRATGPVIGPVAGTV
jgi:hypothetical protein